VILPAANKTYYRVVAVDAEGKRSGPSDYTSAPRPVIYSKPTLQAKVGQPYRGQVSANRSLGDLRKRNPEVANFWDVEHPKYAVKGPSWLKLDEETGTLSGTPDAAGKSEWKSLPPSTRRCEAGRGPAGLGARESALHLHGADRQRQPAVRHRSQSVE